MQAQFESKFYSEREQFQSRLSSRQRRLREIREDICITPARLASDYDAMGKLYKTIFQYVALHADTGNTEGPAASSKPTPDEARELASALESVFPRAGLRLFLSHGREDREDMLRHVTLVVAGIRLYNWDSGKSQSDILNVPGAAASAAQDLAKAAGDAAADAAAMCEQYVRVLAAPRALAEVATAERLDPSNLRAQWTRELANRKQLAVYAGQLHEQAEESLAQAQDYTDQLRGALAELRTEVGERTAVRKEEVFPKFLALGRLWQDAAGLWHSCSLRSRCWDTLEPFAAAAVATLRLDTVRKVRMAAEGTGESAEGVGGGGAEAGGGDEGDEGDEGGVVGVVGVVGKEGGDEGETQKGDGDSRTDRAAGELGAEMSAGGTARVISLESGTETQSLPTEFEGFCPVCLVDHDGLLVAGQPGLGIAEYRGKHFACSTDAALERFCADPESYVHRARTVASGMPELLLLLGVEAGAAAGAAKGGGEDEVLGRLSEQSAQLSEASLPRIIEWEGRLRNPITAAPGRATLGDAMDASAGTGAAPSGTYGEPGYELDKPGMRSVGTDTPVHFHESGKAPGYTFSQWELRRRALQIANLRDCKTTSAQTDMSHSKREAETQAYEA